MRARPAIITSPRQARYRIELAMSNAAAVFLWVAVAAACIGAGDCRIGRATPQDAAAPPLYTNTWAVEVEGGEKVAAALAAKYGFTNKGKVCREFPAGLVELFI